MNRLPKNEPSCLGNRAFCPQPTLGLAASSQIGMCSPAVLTCAIKQALTYSWQPAAHERRLPFRREAEHAQERVRRAAAVFLRDAVTERKRAADQIGGGDPSAGRRHEGTVRGQGAAIERLEEHRASRHPESDHSGARQAIQHRQSVDHRQAVHRDDLAGRFASSAARRVASQQAQRGHDERRTLAPNRAHHLRLASCAGRARLDRRDQAIRASTRPPHDVGWSTNSLGAMRAAWRCCCVDGDTPVVPGTTAEITPRR